MAGDWLKFEANTPEKQEVLAITIALGFDDPDLTVGKLLRVWRWFDQHTVDGNAANVTSALLDRLIGVTGITKAMESVGWMIISEHGLTLPNFDRHNGKTAKQRALTARRVANHKASGEGNAVTVSEALPREEKRREEKNKDKDIPPLAMLTAMGVDESLAKDWLKVRKEKKQAPTQTAFDRIKAHAEANGMTFEQAVRIAVENSWAGFKVSWMTDHPSGPEPDELKGML